MSDRRRWPVAAVAAVALSVVAAVCIAATRAEPSRQMPEQTLVFADEFEQDALDQSRWTTCYWWDDGGCTNSGNQELEWYLPDNVKVEGGVLRLEARQGWVRGSDGASYPYTSGMVSTGRSVDDLAQQPRFGFRYGRVEVRMRMPEGKGLWPALWLLPLTHESRPEIDVMEVLGDTPATLRAHFRYLDDDGERVTRGHTWTGADSSAGWHRYGLRWTPEELVWLVDGKEQWRFSEEEFVPDEPMYLLINLAVGGEWSGDPAPSTEFPAVLEVDYVRVWQRGL
jgi:beta-glucanase (GH16 family)